MASLSSLLVTAKTNALSGKESVLEGMLKTAEQQVVEFAQGLQYTSSGNPNAIKQQITQFRASVYSEQIHNFLISLIQEEAAQEAEAILTYLRSHAAVPNNAGLLDSTGKPLLGMVCGTISYP